MPSSARLKVLLVLGPASGGIGFHAQGLARALTECGIDIRVVTDSHTATRFSFPGLLPVDHLPWHARGPVARAVAGADIVHALGHRAGVKARVWIESIFPVRTRPPLVLSWHNDFPTHGLPGVLHRAAARVAVRAAYGVSGASRDLVATAHALGAQRTWLEHVPSSVAADLVHGPARLTSPEKRAALYESLDADHRCDPHAPLILTVARWAPQKQLPTLARIACALTARGMAYTWVVLGDGEEEIAHRTRAIAAEGGAPLILAGRQQVIPWLEAADVFVLTSRWEARALVIQEAMAAGVPVVASAAGGIVDLLDDGRGWLVPPGDIEGFVGAISQALTDEGHSRATRARSEVRSWPAIDDIGRQWAERYRRILTG